MKKSHKRSTKVFKLKIKPLLASLLLIVFLTGLFLQYLPREIYSASWPGIMNSYQKRKQLNIVNNSGATLSSGTTFQVTVDTSSLIPHVLASCDDVKIVYQTSDTIATELARHTIIAQGSSGCHDSKATIISFPLQTSLADSGTSTSYYVYWGNHGATAYSSATAATAYNVTGATATFAAPFNGSTTAVAAGSGTATIATGAIRYSGGKSALSFDGNGDYVQATGGNNLDIDTAYTIEAWIKPIKTPDQYDTVLENGSGGYGYRLWFRDSGTTIECGRYGTDVGTATATNININQWNHVACVYNGSTTLTTYVNGVAGTPDTSSSGDNSGTNTLEVGRDSALGRYYDGFVDEVRVSNIARYSSTFTPQTSPFVRDANTKLLLHLDENGSDPRVANTAFDDSGNGNHGTITGAKYVSGLVGVDSSTTDTGNISSQSYAGHQGIFVEEGTTNKITNPSFENSTYDTNWNDDGNWWLAGGVSATNAIAAYQAQAASSLSSSYINLANPGTYNAAPGVAPTWDTTNGWTFNGSSQYLTTGILPTSENWSMFVKFSNGASSGYTIPIGTRNDGGTNFHFFQHADGLTYYINSTALTTSLITSGVLAFAGKSAYKNGIADGTISAGALTPPAQDIYIGSGHRAAGPIFYYSGKIQAAAVYNSTLTSTQVAAVTNGMNAVGNLTVTQNTTTPYYKFGSSSAKIVASADGSFTTTINAGNTNSHTLSAYVYDGTSGNVGGTVSSSIASLVFNGTAQTTTYTDMGGGWWRLSYSAAAGSDTQAYGIQVKSGKTVYVDGVQLEEKNIYASTGYSTTYIDGSLGTGYAWTGTANNSTSTRAASVIRYSATNNLSASNGTISFWVNRNIANSAIFFRWSDGSPSNDLSIQCTGSTTSCYFYRKINGGATVTVNGTIAIGSWQFITATWNTSEIGFYVNGSGSTTPSVGTPLNLVNYFNLGYTDTNFLPNAIFSDLRIYNASLSPTQIADIYNSGRVSYQNVGSGVQSVFGDGEAPVAAWKMDEGTGTTTYDSAPQPYGGNNGTISGATWQTEDMCLSGKCLKFDGSDDVVTVPVISSTNTLSTNTVSFWIKPTSVTSSGIINLTSSAYVTVSSGALSATGFTSPIYYINGKATVSPTLTTNTWTHVEITTSTAISADTLTIGKANSLYTTGFLDEVIVYSYVRSAAQVKTDYNARGSIKGSSAILSANIRNQSGGTPLSNGLVGYWKMDESSWTNDCSTGTATDSSGNGYNAKSCPNGTGPTTPAAGKFGNALDLDGVNDYMQPPTLTYGSTSQITLATWVYLDGTAPSYTSYIGTAISCGGSLWSGGLTAGVVGTGIYLPMNDGNCHYATGTAPSTGGWHHIVGTYDGKKLRYFVDGAQSSTTQYCWGSCGTGTAETEYVGTHSLSTTQYIGTSSWDPFGHINGKMDEVRIYNRALSPAEVRQLYDWAPGPYLHLSFDDGTGTTISDKSGNSYNGTWNGTGSHWTTGKYGKAAVFNGSSDYISFSSLPKPANMPLTIEFWVKPNSSSPQGIFDSSPSNTNTLRNCWAGDVEWWNASPHVSLNATASTWQHMTFVYNHDGTNRTITYYKNGVLQTTASAVDTSTFNWTTFRLGNINNGLYWYSGVLDEFKIYNYARTQKQIIEDMTGGQTVTAGSGRTSSSKPAAPIAYYKFNEGADNTCLGGVNDVCNSGSGDSALDGAQSGMSVPATATSGWTNSGKIGKALNFDGSDDYINLTGRTLIADDSPYTISLWAKTNSSSGLHQLFNSGQVGATGYSVLIRQSNSDWMANHYSGSSDPEVRHTGGVTVGAWTHIVMTWDGANIRLYTQGILRATTAVVTHGRESTYNYIGAEGTDYASPSEFFNGIIDNVRVYNYALNQDEIKLDYNQGSALTLGVIGDNSSYEKQAANQAYCVPGDTTSCAAPVAEWKFDEGTGTAVYDFSGNANTGILGEYSWNVNYVPTWVAGKHNKGLKFDGVDDYIKITNTASSLNLSAWTFSTWINWKGTTSVGYSGIVVGIGGANNANRLYILDSDSKLRVMGTCCTASIISSTTFNKNQWYHIEVIQTGGVPTLYVNGKLDTVGSSGTFTGGSTNLAVGRAANDTYYFNGIIDDVKIYNYVRSTAQIAYDYNRGKPIAQYKFDECQGLTAYDSSGNMHNGTISIGATVPQSSVGTCNDGLTTSAWYNGLSGKYNSSLNFDGVDDYMERTGFAFLTPPYTLSAWIKPSSLGIGSYYAIITRGGLWADNTNYDFGIRCASASNCKLYLYWRNGSSLNGTEITSSAITAGQWIHVATTIDSSYNFQLFVNGTSIGTSSGSAPTDGSQALRIGAWSGTQLTSNYFPGQIDDVRIYNYTLTNTQVKNMYNNGAVNFAQ